jgi:hypothetical protein
MLVVLIIGLAALALLAVFLKRRHARKVDKRRSASSGFPTARGASSPETGHGRDMWGPHQHMAHTGGWGYTTEQDREIREASAEPGGGLLSTAVGKSKSLRVGSKRKLGRKSRHDSQRSARQIETDAGGARGEEAVGARNAGAAAGSRRERRRERERELERDKVTPRSLGERRLNHDADKAGKEKHINDTEEGALPQMSEKEKDMS